MPNTVSPTRTGPVDRTAVADELLGAIAAVRRTVRRLSGRPAVLAALTGAQLELVRLVRRRPGISVAEAAEELRLAPNTVSTLVGQLTERGVMLRLVDPMDRRVARLDLEPETRRKVTAWRDRRVEALADALGRMAPADQAIVADALAVLARLADAVEEAP
ncbi:MAG TPA: MarR family transcriptional regulator [Acidimicrobiales bacterium]